MYKMSDRTKKIIYLIYGILLSVLLIVSGILLMVSCYNIYQLGNRPFTPDSIAEAFGKIQIILYVTVGAVVVGGCLKIIMPLDESSFKAKVSPRTTLDRLTSKYDLSSCEKEDLAPVTKTKTLRVVLRVAACALCVLLSLPALIIVCLPTSFTADYNQSVINLCYLIIPCFLACALVASAYVYTENLLINKQIKTIKALIVDGKASKLEKSECSECKCRKEKYSIVSTRVIVIAVALIFIVLGIFNGGMSDVLSKAINICTECIGLG